MKTPHSLQLNELNLIDFEVLIIVDRVEIRPARYIDISRPHICHLTLGTPNTFYPIEAKLASVFICNENVNLWLKIISKVPNTWEVQEEARFLSSLLTPAVVTDPPTL